MTVVNQKKYPHLFEPLYVKSAKTPFKNRVLCAPNAIYNFYGLDVNHTLNEFGLLYFNDLAKGGAASVILPVLISTDPDQRDDLLVDPGNGNHARMHLLQRSVHAYQAKSFLQLTHAGRCAAVMANKKVPILASTEGEYQGNHVKALDEQDMKEIIQQYAAICRNAKRSGFDGIQLHFAHGWLVHDFLSPLSNKRNDEYGGSVENRVRFPLRILKAVREAVGDDMIIELRLDGSDEVEGGITPEDTAQQLLYLQDYADMAHITCGTRLDNTTRAKMHPTYVLPKVHNAWASEIIKNTPGIHIPIGVVGYISTPEEAEQLIAEGKADYILLCRSLIADPDWVNKAKTGQTEDIRPCLRCDYCLDHGRRKALFKGKELCLMEETTFDSRCAVNPLAFHGISKKLLPKPERVKNIAVVGGGPAGMNAAITAAERGHKVTLYESSGTLGGQIKLTDEVSFKGELKAYHEYLEKKIRSNDNITLRIGTKATPELIRESGVDAAVIALGAKQKIPHIPGIEKAVPSMGAFSRPERYGKKVVIIGGSYVGTELALYLAEHNHEVTVVEQTDYILPTCELSLRVSLLQELENRKVDTLEAAEAIEILDEGVKVISKGKGEFVLEADSVIYAVGTKPLTERGDAFRDSAPEVIYAGDVLGDVLDVPHAVETGFDAGYIL